MNLPPAAVPVGWFRRTSTMGTGAPAHGRTRPSPRCRIRNGSVR